MISLVCYSCDHLNTAIDPVTVPTENTGEWIIACRFFKPPVIQQEREDCVGWIQKEEPEEL